MSENRIHETLRRLFDAVVEEAKQNPALARKHAHAIGQNFGARPRSPKPAPRRAFDASQFHAVNILRLHGECALRGKLEQVKAVEDPSPLPGPRLVLSGIAGKARQSRAELITEIVEAAKHYDAERNAAIT
jgi:hypothetical protein